LLPGFSGLSAPAISRMDECYPTPLTVCSATETAFKTNAETTNLWFSNQLHGVTAFAPIFYVY
jgi:hypothetical protein